MTSDLFFESLQEQYKANLPFVAYRKPNTVEVLAMLQEDDTLNKTTNFDESGFVFSPFDNIEDTLLIPLGNSSTIKASYTVSVNDDKCFVDSNYDSKAKEQHISLINKAVEAIEKDELKKVVLSRTETVQLKESDALELFTRLLNTYTTAFVYCWFHPKIGLWLGATPETLMKVEGQRLSTMALAGTQKFEGTTDVQWHDKEKEEQQIVTNVIVERLKPLCETVKISEITTVKAGSLLHLKTKITANLIKEQFSLKQAIEALHPTPAVCGFPTFKAKQFILEHEHYNRTYYTGFLGELNVKQSRTRNTNRRNVENNAYATIKTVSDLFVNLRCMQLKDEKAMLYIGGGITGDSNPDAEWEETVNKSEIMKRIL